MGNSEKFVQLNHVYFKRLQQYVPVVAKVHGNNHPEFFAVKKVWEQMETKLKSPAEKTELAEEFAQLRQITENYVVPADVCETYEAVYEMLQELDEAYSA